MAELLLHRFSNAGRVSVGLHEVDHSFVSSRNTHAHLRPGIYLSCGMVGCSTESELSFGCMRPIGVQSDASHWSYAATEQQWREDECNQDICDSRVCPPRTVRRARTFTTRLFRSTSRFMAQQGHPSKNANICSHIAMFNHVSSVTLCEPPNVVRQTR